MSSRACAGTGSLTAASVFWRRHERTELIITDALTWPVSRMAAATRRALTGLPPLRITEQMASRINPAVALRALVYPSLRTRVRSSGARPAMNILLETASRAWPRIRKFIIAAHWSSYSVMLRWIVAKSGLWPRFRAVGDEQFVDRVCGLHPVEQPGNIARLRGRQRVQGVKIEDPAEQRGDLRPGQIRPAALFCHPFDVDPEGLRGLARGGRIACAVLRERRRGERRRGEGPGGF